MRSAYFTFAKEHKTPRNSLYILNIQNATRNNPMSNDTKSFIDIVYIFQ